MRFYAKELILTMEIY